MAYIAMALILIAYIAMAHILIVYIVMAYIYLWTARERAQGGAVAAITTLPLTMYSTTI